MKRAKENVCDEEFFGILYDRYATGLKFYLYGKFQDPDKVEDILQSTFLKLWENCHKVPADGVKNYLYMVARNAFIDHKRHLQIVRKYEKDFSGNQTDEHTPEADYMQTEFLQKLNEAIDNLPPKQRVVFIMSKWEGKKYREIAAQLNISVKAVEKRMSTALKNLRDKLKDEGRE